ncbi:MAG: hypothetical protein QM756_42195 [Polyangiaceae bacterium]
MTRSAPSRDVAEFLKSMPGAYAQHFNLRDVEEHMQIVGRRGQLLAHAEAWHGALKAPFVCVVADDRPGLLSFVTDALLVYGLNIKSAQVYCRLRSDGVWEAIDFFCVEPSSADAEPSMLERAELDDFAQTLRELISEEQVVERRSSERDTIPVPKPRPARVYFDLEALRRDEMVLVVDAPDFSGLLFAIASALHGQGARIVASEIMTEDGVARDRFHLSRSESQALNGELLCDIQQAVWSALRGGGKA